MKLAATARTPEKIEKGIVSAGGDTAKYFNSSLRKKKEKSYSPEFPPSGQQASGEYEEPPVVNQDKQNA